MQQYIIYNTAERVQAEQNTDDTHPVRLVYEGMRGEEEEDELRACGGSNGNGDLCYLLASWRE